MAQADFRSIDRHLKQKGAVHARAMASLEESDIRGDNERTGLTEFARSIRSFCQIRFRGADQSTGSGTNLEEDSDSDNESTGSAESFSSASV